MMSGRRHPLADGRLPDGPAGARRERSAELTGAVRTMRAKMLAIEGPADAIDTCGTGGDAKGTLNVSTGAPPSWSRPAACRWPSTATARSPPKAAPPTCWRRMGVNLDADLSSWSKRRAGRDRHLLPDGAAASQRPCAMSARPGSSWAPGPSSTCWDRCPTRRGSSGSSIGVFAEEWIEPLAQVLKSPRTTRRPGSCTAPTAWTSSATTGPSESRRARQGRDQGSSRCTPGRRRPAARRRLAGPDGRRRGRPMPPRCGPCWAARPAPIATSWSTAFRRPPCWSPARRRTLKQGAEMAAAKPSTAARPRKVLDRPGGHQQRDPTPMTAADHPDR